MGACCAKRSAPGARAGPNAEVQVRPNFDSPLPRTLREEVVISREIDVDVERTQQQASRVKKLLLLGAGPFQNARASPFASLLPGSHSNRQVNPASRHCTGR